MYSPIQAIGRLRVIHNYIVIYLYAAQRCRRRSTTTTQRSENLTTAVGLRPNLFPAPDVCTYIYHYENMRKYNNNAMVKNILT